MDGIEVAKTRLRESLTDEQWEDLATIRGEKAPVTLTDRWNILDNITKGR